MLHERLADVVGPRYALERELAGGGMARVFLARDPLLDRRVVIKVLPPERATAVGMERFHREARLLAKLNHPHIIPILDTGASHELPWFAMPWIAGQTLADRIAGGPLAVQEVRAIGRELLDALAHAHRLGVVHRDIKPSNIFLHAGHALLGDFGVAALTASSGEGLTDAGVVVGTLGYMAPEHRMSGVSDERSDTWELAATLYEACTAVRWTVAASSNDPWRAVPAKLRVPLQRGLAERPSERWPDAAAFGAALRSPRRSAIQANLLVAGLSIVALIAWQQLPDRDPIASALAIGDPVQFLAEPDAAPWVTEVARHAALTLRWVPGIGRLSGDIAGNTAPIKITMREIPGTDSLLMVGLDATNAYVLRERVGSAAADWSRAVVDRAIERLYPARIVDFRLLVHSTENLQALNAWYRGGEAFQSARWDDADRHYREALRHDSTFVAASWSLLLTDMWRRETHHAALADLIEQRELLPPIIRTLVEAQVEPHLPTRIARFDSVAAAYPDFGPARLLQANELFHRGPLIGRPLRDGVDAFIAAAREVPELDHRTTWQHVLWGAIRLGDELVARDAWDRLSGWPGDGELTAFLGLALDARFSAHGATARRGLLHLFATDARLASMSRYLRLGSDFDIPHEVERMARLVAHRTDDAELRAGSLATLATMLLMAGRLQESLATLDRAATVSAATDAYLLQAAEWRMLLPMFGVPVTATERTTATATLVRLAGSPSHWARAVWTLAVSDSTAFAASWGDSLRRGASHDAIAAHLLPLWRAHRIAAEAGPHAALEMSSAILMDPGDSIVIARGPLARAVTYYARGRWSLQLGDAVGAEREWRWHENNDLQGWPSGPPQDGELDAALSVPARLLRATILCETGMAEQGNALVRRADELWSGADQSLGPSWPQRRTAELACR
jgi:serine/threonine protein kinase